MIGYRHGNGSELKPFRKCDRSDFKHTNLLNPADEVLMFSGNLYCFDTSDIYIAGRTGTGGEEFFIYAELCVRGEEYGCAPTEKVLAWASTKLLYIIYQDLFIDIENYDEPLQG